MKKEKVCCLQLQLLSSLNSGRNLKPPKQNQKRRFQIPNFQFSSRCLNDYTPQKNKPTWIQVSKSLPSRTILNSLTKPVSTPQNPNSKPHKNPHKTPTQSLSSHPILSRQVLQPCLKRHRFAQCPPHCLPKPHDLTIQQCPQLPWLAVSSQLGLEVVWYRRNGPPTLWASVWYWSLLCHNDALKNERWVLGLTQLEIKGFDWSY